MIEWKTKGIFKADAEAVAMELESIEGERTPEEIVNIINLAGFGIGIGSGRRNCKNGRYHVVDVK